MWLVTEIGFFNIVQQDDDFAKGLLTVKARSDKDISLFKQGMAGCGEIEESDKTDYRFRLKAPKLNVINLVCELVQEIDYPKTKPAITERFPKRNGVYLATWAELAEIQNQDV